MKLLDALKLLGLIEDIKAQVEDLAEMPLGDETQVYLPVAKGLNALLIRGRGGKRYRIVGVIAQRER